MQATSSSVSASRQPVEEPSQRITAILRDEVYREIELVPMICGEIADKKLTSDVVRTLNRSYPLPDFSYLKRVKAGKKDTNLVLITSSVTGNSQEEITTLEQTLPKIVGLGRLSEVEVPRWKPITRKQFEAAVQYWPTQFHEDKRLEKALRGDLFSRDELDKMEQHMRVAVEEAKAAQAAGTPPVGAVMVDPSTNCIVARAHTDASHPLKHAVMVCIDGVARRQGGGAWNGKTSLLQLKPSVMSTQEMKPGESSQSAAAEDIGLPPPPKKPKRDKQYLCTGYDLYSTREPCVMCAMALVHSRIGRVFYGSKNPSAGGLGSQYKIHTQEGLNHHFDVYTIGHVL